MRSILMTSVAALFVVASLPTEAQAQSKVVVNLKNTKARESSRQPVEIVKAQPRAVAPSLNILETSSLNAVSAALDELVRTFAGDPDPFVREAVKLYSQTGGQPIWYRASGWSHLAEDTYRILDQAAFDGLPRSKYLKDLREPLSTLRTNKQAAGADFTLTVGLLKFVMDLKFGLNHKVLPGEVADGFKSAYQAEKLDLWADGFRPETPLYLRLHKALLLGELSERQSHMAAVTLHRERAPLLVHPERHIIVNVGLQQLRVYEDRKEVLAMPVVVGKPARPTPLLSDQIVNLKFSPDWSVPPVIAREDILPILQSTPQVIEDMGIDVLDKENQRVVPTSVDWKEVDPRNIPFRFKMKPGIDNLLGGVRFSLTNDLAIYLHDSPERDRFGEDSRAFSSGCIRVGDSATLASWIMGRQKNWQRKDVIAAMVKGKTRIEKLPDPIKVDFIYSTVGFSDDGALVFKPDIYGEDAKLARKLGLPSYAQPPTPRQR